MMMEKNRIIYTLKGFVKRGIPLLLCFLFLLKGVEGDAQQIVTLTQQQAIGEIAIDRVKVFSGYLSLLAREREEDKAALYRQYLALSLSQSEDLLPVRLYNDLLPAVVQEKNPILNRHLLLEEYLHQIGENYAHSLHLFFDSFEVQQVGYSDFLQQHFVVVTARRELKGMYRKGSQLTESRAEAAVDFFVDLQVNPDSFYVGGIFGMEPYEDRKELTDILTIEDPAPPAGAAKASFREPIKAKATRKTIRLRRGEEHALEWTGGVKDDIVEIELVPLNPRKRKSHRFAPLRNKFSARVLVGKEVRPGMYRFRITNITTGRYTQTGFIKVKRKLLFFGAASLHPGPYG